MNNHHRKIIYESLLRDKGTHNLLCNCRVKEECLMGGKRNSENVVYQANIFPKEGNFKDKIYIGISALNWKLRWYNHWQSFINPLLENQTALSIIGL